MSRLRANEVLNKDADGPFLATEGINIPSGKNITYNGLGDVTFLDGTSLTTSTLNVDQINLGDNDILNFGDNNDLRILHNGSYSLVGDFGTGNLILAGNTSIDLMNPGATEYYARFNNNGAVQLYYDNAVKFATTTTGVAITGSITSTDGWVGTTSSADVLGGLAMPFSCGLNGRIALPPVGSTMLFGGSEYSGDNTEGATMPHDGVLVAATLHAENATGDLALRATVNGTQNSSYELSFSSPTQSSPSVVETFYASPMSFSAGDRLNFGVSSTTLTQLEVLTVTFFVKFA